MNLLGSARSTPSDCKAYLLQLSLEYYEICKAAIGGQYEGKFFHHDSDEDFSPTLITSVRRTRAVVQFINARFSARLRNSGHKYQITEPKSKDSESLLQAMKTLSVEDNRSDVDQIENASSNGGSDGVDDHDHTSTSTKDLPMTISKETALIWVGKVLARTRGKEVHGNFSPLVIAELFWEQSSRWQEFAQEYMEQIGEICDRFLRDLLKQKCPPDVQARVWSTHVSSALKARNQAASHELDRIIEDLKGHPMNYNRFYVDTVAKKRQERTEKVLGECIKKGAVRKQLIVGCNQFHLSNHMYPSTNAATVVDDFSTRTNPNLEVVRCEEALDCLSSLYDVSVCQLIGLAFPSY